MLSSFVLKIKCLIEIIQLFIYENISKKLYKYGIIYIMRNFIPIQAINIIKCIRKNYNFLIPKIIKVQTNNYPESCENLLN